MIDAAIPETWPSEVVNALQKFRLGHIIERPPFAIAFPAEFRIWTPNGDAAEQSPMSYFEWDFGMITTQTCDLREEQAAYPRMPFVQYCPVYKIANTRDDFASLTKPQYLFPLTADRFQDGIWVADMRLEGSADKGILVDKEPIEGFRVETDDIAFAELLGRRRDRAAMANMVNTALYRTMSGKARNNRNRARQSFAAVHSLRLEVADGTRLEPVALKLHVLFVPNASDEQKVFAHGWFEIWWDAARAVSEDGTPSVRLMPTQFHDSSAMDVTLLDRLIPFPFAP